MGAVCACGSASELKTSEASETNKSTTNIHSSQEILDDNFKSEITKAIDKYIVTVPTAYQTEHDRIVNEMSRSAPSPYLGLSFSDYPDVNGSTVSYMARRLATFDEVKQQLIDQIDQSVEPSFTSRTTDWTSSARDAARPLVRIFIEKHVNDAFDHVKLE